MMFKNICAKISLAAFIVVSAGTDSLVYAAEKPASAYITVDTNTSRPTYNLDLLDPDAASLAVLRNENAKDKELENEVAHKTEVLLRAYGHKIVPAPAADYWIAVSYDVRGPSAQKDPSDKGPWPHFVDFKMMAAKRGSPGQGILPSMQNAMWFANLSTRVDVYDVKTALDYMIAGSVRVFGRDKLSFGDDFRVEQNDKDFEAIRHHTNYFDKKLKDLRFKRDHDEYVMTASFNPMWEMVTDILKENGLAISEQNRKTGFIGTLPISAGHAKKHGFLNDELKNIAKSMDGVDGTYVLSVYINKYGNNDRIKVIVRLYPDNARSSGAFERQFIEIIRQRLSKSVKPTA